MLAIDNGLSSDKYCFSCDSLMHETTFVKIFIIITIPIIPHNYHLLISFNFFVAENLRNFLYQFFSSTYHLLTQFMTAKPLQTIFFHIYLLQLQLSNLWFFGRQKKLLMLKDHTRNYSISYFANLFRKFRLTNFGAIGK